MRAAYGKAIELDGAVPFRLAWMPPQEPLDETEIEAGLKEGLKAALDWIKNDRGQDNETERALRREAESQMKSVLVTVARSGRFNMALSAFNELRAEHKNQWDGSETLAELARVACEPSSRGSWEDKHSRAERLEAISKSPWWEGQEDETWLEKGRERWLETTERAARVMAMGSTPEEREAASHVAKKSAIKDQEGFSDGEHAGRRLSEMLGREMIPGKNLERLDPLWKELSASRKIGFAMGKLIDSKMGAWAHEQMKKDCAIDERLRQQYAAASLLSLEKKRWDAMEAMLGDRLEGEARAGLEERLKPGQIMQWHFAEVDWKEKRAQWARKILGEQSPKRGDAQEWMSAIGALIASRQAKELKKAIEKKGATTAKKKTSQARI